MRSVVLILSTLILPLSLFASPINLPDIGDSAGEISPEKEYRTGQAVMRNLYRASQLVDDPLTEDYLNSLGYKLVAASPQPGQRFHFFTVNDGNINAFALPGGFIGINYGLILSTHAESELAAVMAHEIAHVTQRHHARRYTAPTNNIPVLAALIAAMVMGSKDHEVAEAALATLAAKAAQDSINFTRANEQEADRVGIDILFHAHYDTHSMASIFETMDRNSRLYGDTVPEFLRTHPVHPSRIADSQNRANQYPRRLVGDDKNYLLSRERLNVMHSEDKKAVLKHYHSALKTGRHMDQEAARYGYTLALLQNDNFALARTQMQKLLKADPQRIAYLLLAAQIEETSGHTGTALKKYRSALRQYPGHPAIVRYYSRTLLKDRQAKEARQILQKTLASGSTHPMLYHLLADAESQLGHTASAHEAMASYYYHAGQTHEALAQLSLALQQKNLDFYQTSRMEAQKKALQEEIKLLQQRDEKK